jgi:Tol biopolymer transport system component
MSQPDNAGPGLNQTSGAQGSIQVKNLLLLGAGGVALLFCFVLLVGFGFLLGNLDNSGRFGEILAGSGELAEEPTPPPVVVTATSTATPIVETGPGPEQTPTETGSQNAGQDNTATPTPPGEPEIGVIIFAATVSKEGEPLNPGNSFEEGIHEMHAVFNYNHMSKGYTWERVWYLDGQEILRNSEEWSGAESGQFDYFLDTGESALPAGKWTLELYVEGQLLAEGSFTVKPKEIAQAPTPTPTSTFTPTPAPTSAPAATRQSSSSRTYQLVYSKWDGGAHNLYIADTTGKNEQLIFTRAAGPSWSPDKKRLFFVGEQGVTQQVRQGRVDCEFGTISDGVVAIDVPSPLRDICQVQPGAWSCERKQIDLQTEPSDVCTANGIAIYQNLDWKVGSARWASASPDGDALAFDAKPGGDYRIYFRAMLGTSQQFRFELVGEQGSWSPDGQRMVYRSGRDNKAGLWISNRDDSGHTSITIDGSDSFPAWSPQGQTIAFSRKMYGNVDIFTINVDRTNLTRLTDHPGHDTLPVYTPNGDIIFRSDRSGSWGIWKMSGSGGGQTEIIPNAGVGLDWAYSKMDVR